MSRDGRGRKILASGRRTRISYFALLATTTYAVFLEKTAYY
jgi:hypothetical protein